MKAWDRNISSALRHVVAPMLLPTLVRALQARVLDRIAVYRIGSPRL